MLKKFSFITYLSVFSLPLALFYAPNFAPVFSAESISSTIIFYIAYLSHFFLVFLIAFSLFSLPILFFRKYKKKSYFYIITVLLLSYIVLVVDAHVFKLYRFHINLAMLDLFLNANGEVISFNFNMYLDIIKEIILLLLYAVFAFFLSYFAVKKHIKVRIFAWFLIFFYVFCNFANAYAKIKDITSLTEISSRIPLYKPLTMNSFLLKMGLVSPEDLKKEKISVNAEGLFNYPKQDLKLAPNYHSEYNLLFILLDSWRYDCFNEDNMPYTYAFSQSGITFNNHYSSSNSTRGGVFGLFYGIPPLYWQVALNTSIPSIFTTVAKERGYAVNAFASATLLKPEFNRTVFSTVENLRISSDGANAVERDLDAIKDFKLFAKNSKDNNKNFFSFIFLDNVHSSSYPKDFKAPYKSDKESINYLDINKDTYDSYFNIYKNAVAYADRQIEDIISFLNNENLLENTIVVISSDHGEEFYDNSLKYGSEEFYGHNSNFTDVQVKVPLIIYDPRMTSRAGEVVNFNSINYDFSATFIPDIFGVQNDISDYSVGKNLYNLNKDRPYFVLGSYLENAIVEKDRIVLIDKLGILHFKDKHYQDSKDKSHNKNLIEYLEQSSSYLK